MTSPRSSRPMSAITRWAPAEPASTNSLAIGLTKDHAAIFFPWLTITENGVNRNVGPTGAIAGLMARIDSAAGSGVWVAPAGTGADIRGGVVGLASYLSNDQNGLLNP